MRAPRTSPWIGALAFAALPSCATERPVVPPAVAALVGAWASAREAVAGQGGGSWQRTLDVTADGRAVHRGISYGLYAGQGPEDVSAEVALYGRLRASATSFVIEPDSIVTRDRVGGTFARTVQRDAGPADSTRYVVRGDALELTSRSYPAEVLMRRY